MLVFVVPLRSPGASKDWRQISQLCERTLRSVCAQSCPDFHVILVCSERPETAFRHPRLTVIEEDFPLPLNQRGRELDKWAKIDLGLAAARELGPAHFMLVDADDCVHRDLAATVAADPQAHGWIIERGYLHQEGSRWLVRKTGFHRLCGTSSIVRLTDDGPFGHTIVADCMRERGTPLIPLPYPGAVYVWHRDNHGGNPNIWLWQGRRKVLHQLASARPLTAKIRASFGLYDLAAVPQTRELHTNDDRQHDGEQDRQRIGVVPDHG